MRYVYTERIINARALQLSHDQIQVLKIVPYIRRHSLKENVAVYKDLNIEFVTKKSFCHENALINAVKECN